MRDLGTRRDLTNPNITGEEPVPRFNVSGKIQRIFVPKEVADRLSDGRLGIAVLADQFEVLPRSVVEKITAINNQMVVILNDRSGDDTDDPDDPYAEYKVPDDLVW